MNKIFVFSVFNYESNNGGGITSAIRNLILNLKSNFHFINIYNSEKLQHESPDFIYLNPNYFYFLKLYFFLKKHRPEIVFINGFFSINSSLIPYLISILLKNKIIISPRGMLKNTALKNNNIIKLLVLKLYKLFLSDYVVFHATNSLEREEIIQIFGNKSKIYIISDIPPLQIAYNFKEFPKKKNEIDLLYLARIDGLKNLKFILKILYKIYRNNRISYKINFNIAGEISDQLYWNECINTIENLKQFENLKINYLGKLDKNQIDVIFKKMHLLFLPTNGENYGYSIAESLSHSIPVLISDKTPFRNLDKIDFGYDIPLKNEDYFSEILLKYIRLDNNEFQKIRINIYKKYNTFVNIEKIIQDYNNFFKIII